MLTCLQLDISPPGHQRRAAQPAGAHRSVHAAVQGMAAVGVLQSTEVLRQFMLRVICCNDHAAQAVHFTYASHEHVTPRLHEHLNSS
jgi:hypothetical protein